uniref:Transmembrane protein 188 n=1 Tax=Megaselia scalaris TaxID=36166 RepID=T1GC05_MEGSC
MESSACDDLKSFERRLTEVVTCYQPAAKKWRIILAVIASATAIGAYYWLKDPDTSIVPFNESLFNHKIFSLAIISLIMLFLAGVDNLVIAPKIITSRTRTVLSNYNMSCDDTGKLILRPRPTN